MISSPPPTFYLTHTPDGAAVLHVRGEVDLASADRFRERLLDEFARHPRLVVDLSEAMLFDGAALRALLALHREATGQHRQAPTLRGLRPLLAKAFKATGMNELFPIEPSPPFPQWRRRREAARAAAQAVPSAA
ncbi:STAS domain-containing protein [Actinocrinis puniceicyclus]|uniref:STAS domain-containing protein n=1 Tax=Actinocrinis puniceicyclus TaxID=977794 RepID=A0A8J7WID2_9ACTN|nr:STAS domain-containing protein [Actinocrinis puniceicyclus]MBS2961475.1 STAS domain-containing protein [Actinocrinis puniceicyclus]